MFVHDGITYSESDIETRDCDNCATGVVECVGVDWSSDCGAAYDAVRGSSHPERFTWLCPACTAAEVGFEAEYGCAIAPLAPPRAERAWRLPFEIAA